jgi:tRNA (guanine37-N1)-methyltransferase
MRIEVLSLFPHYIEGPLQESILKRAQDKGLIEVFNINIRDFADNRWKKVDDRPFGGGPGMLMMAPPVVKTIRSVKTPTSKVIYLSPQGKKLTSQKARELSKESHLILLCGHYEGIDERALELEVHEEISIGDYVLTNGCLGALVLIDAISRFIPGVLGHEDASQEDSFENGLLDYPQYTKPLEFEGKKVPDVLLQGDHQAILRFRQEKALSKTLEKRPDLGVPFLLEKPPLQAQDKDLSLSTLVLYSNHFEKTVSFYEHVLGVKASFQKECFYAVFQIGEFFLRIVRRDEPSLGALSFTLPLQQLKKAFLWHEGKFPKTNLAKDKDGFVCWTVQDPDGRYLDLRST